jgi:hypothetical protein
MRWHDKRCTHAPPWQHTLLMHQLCLLHTALPVSMSPCAKTQQLITNVGNRRPPHPLSWQAVPASALTLPQAPMCIPHRPITCQT